MKINIREFRTGLGLQLFDAWYAFKQSQAQYTPDFELTITKEQQLADLNALYSYMPSNVEVDKYDLVFFCNGGEPLQVATDYIKQCLELDHCYLMSNSLLTADHKLANKVIWFPHNIKTCRDYWTRDFYPQYFENMQNTKLPRNQGMMVINGQNRSWRHDVFSRLEEIKFHNKLSTGVTVTDDAHWETEEDVEYREYVNSVYQAKNQKYYSNCVPVGVDKKFGMVGLGYFIMPEYFTHDCIVFPETSWQNNELAVTEKALKCFYAGSIPFPVGGANINSLYNQIGFSTAWNLLPDLLKVYDSEQNHFRRVQQTVAAIQWLNNNQSVFQTEQCQQMRRQNLIRFLTCSSDYDSVVRLDQVLTNYLPNSTITQ